MTSLAEGYVLIACCGKIMDEVCAAAIAEMARRHPKYRLRFVMSDWIAPDQLARAAVFWVVDPAAGLADIAPALEHGIPLLVPESSGALKQACIRGNYGLFFQTEAEAAACLIYLVSNPATRNMLARNAAASAATAGTR